MSQGHFGRLPLKRRLHVYEDRSAGKTIYFPANSAESIPALFLCPSLNIHPFVGHRVYLYITNLHQG